MPFEPRDVQGTTPLDDYSGLKLLWVSNHAQLDAAEADNIRLAQNKYFKKRTYPCPKWFIVSHFNLVHKEMFGQVWDWAGKYRRTEKNIGVPPYLIPVEMFKLEEDIKFWSLSDSFDPLELSARVHYRLVWIHPYENGNGRHGRFIGDMILKAFQRNVIEWPNFTDGEKERDLYIKALQEGDRGDLSPLVDFLTKYS